MKEYIAKKLFLLIPTVLAVPLLVFAMMRFIPGDPFGAACKIAMAQGYGDTPYEHPHHGIDLVCPFGTPEVSVADGVVYRTNTGCPAYGAWLDMCGGGYGNFVMVDSTFQVGDQHGTHHLYILYAHMKQDPSVQPGQAVQPGTLLGFEGSSGWSSGPHLHFEIDLERPVTTASTNPSFMLQPGLF